MIEQKIKNLLTDSGYIMFCLAWSVGIFAIGFVVGVIAMSLPLGS